MLEEDLKNVFSQISIFIQELSMELKLEFSNMKRLFPRSLAKMGSFNKDFSFLPVTLAKLSWTHNYTLIEEEMDGEKHV